MNFSYNNNSMSHPLGNRLGNRLGHQVWHGMGQTDDPFAKDAETIQMEADYAKRQEEARAAGQVSVRSSVIPGITGRVGVKKSYRKKSSAAPTERGGVRKPEDWMKKLGITKENWWMYAAGAVAAVVVLPKLWK